ncbi:tubulin binding cofactor C-domain-containing protein [Mycena crocata]|nr:tubulin binding cofactor C-domain-containing protein [Mycena crocata]
MASADPAWSFSQSFSTQFQSSRKELESRVESTKSTITADALQNLSTDLAKLTKTLADATGSLPSYDQRQYELQLKGLEKSLEELRLLIPKSKFAFKRKAAVPSAQVLVPAPVIVAEPHSQPPISTNLISTNLSLSSHSLRYLSKASLPSASQASDLTISDLNKCIVNLLTDVDGNSSSVLEISALHVRNLTDCILLLPILRGSVLIHDLRRCILVVGCHQFRMHASSSVDVYLSIPSTPVIEHCSQIRFSSYPVALSADTSAKDFLVQDFSHIKSTPSPNWSMLPKETLATQWPIDTLASEQEVSNTLSALLPSSATE